MYAIIQYPINPKLSPSAETNSALFSLPSNLIPDPIAKAMALPTINIMANTRNEIIIESVHLKPSR